MRPPTRVLWATVARLLRQRASRLLLLAMLLIAACSTPQTGAPGGGIADFSMAPYQGAEVLGGEAARLSTLLARGKPVVLNFWAGQCPPCRAEMPAFQQLADEYEGRVLFLGVDVGVFTQLGTHEDGRRLLQQLDIRYPAAYASDATPLRAFSVRSMPTTLFITASGRVVERADGMLLEPQLRDAVQKLLAARS